MHFGISYSRIGPDAALAMHLFAIVIAWMVSIILMLAQWVTIEINERPIRASPRGLALGIGILIIALCFHVAAVADWDMQIRKLRRLGLWNGGIERTDTVYGLQRWLSRQKREPGKRQRRVLEEMEMWEWDIERKAEGKARLVTGHGLDISDKLV